MKQILLSFTAILFLGACSNTKKTTTVKDLSPDNLYQKWDLVSLNDEIYNVKTDNKILIDFSQQGRVSGTSGCNRYFGNFTTSTTGNSLEFGPLAGTKMACEDEINQWETKYLKTLEGVNGYMFNDNKLILTTNGSPVAEFVQSNAAPDELTGKWELYYITRPKIIFSALFPEEKPFLEFHHDRSAFFGFTGCNTLNSYFNNKPGEKLFSEGVLTMKACPGGGEDFFMKYFREADKYEVSGDELTLFVDGEAALKFKKMKH